MRQALVPILLTSALLLSGCDVFTAPSQPEDPGPGQRRAAPTRDEAFVYSASEDISGYYRPVGAVGADDFSLVQIFVGQPQAFEAWSRGERNQAFAPMVLEFSVVGGGSLRVSPDRYSVSDSRVSMQGTAPGVGAVSVDLRLDKGALATARRNLGGSEAAAMTGAVRIGDQTYSGVKLAWYGGD